MLVMGVSGSGKTTLAAALAARLGYAFIEGDALHPESNIHKMASGIALQDEDRWPWLARVAASLRGKGDAPGVIVTCSALKRIYRDFIRARSDAPVFIVYISLERSVLVARLQERRGHFMPPTLLSSQLATLEEPQGDEQAVFVDGSLATEDQMALVLSRWN